MSKERVEIRRNDDGTIDEVVLYVGKRCVFHLEQMTAQSWYFGLYPHDRGGVLDGMEQFSIHAKGRVRVRNYKDAA